MTSSPENPLEVLAGLLEERRRYEGWIAQLDERRGQAPDHVVQRVRADYVSRLDGVMGQLRGRASDLQSSAAALRTRIESLVRRGRASGGTSARRPSCGRPSASSRSDAAQAAIASCDEAIARLSSERNGQEGELRKLEEILAQVGTPIEVAAREPAPPPVPAAPAPPPPHAPTPPSALRGVGVPAVGGGHAAAGTAATRRGAAGCGPRGRRPRCRPPAAAAAHQPAPLGDTPEFPDATDARSHRRRAAQRADPHAREHSVVLQGHADRAGEDAEVPGVRHDELPHRVVLRALRGELAAM